MQIRHLDRVRNDRDGAPIPVQFRHRQTDSLDRDRALVHRIFLDVLGQFNVQPPILRFGDALELDQFADPIHVSLHDVSAESAVGLHRQFKIDQRPFVNPGERSPHPSFRCKIGAERSRLDVESGQADTAHRHTAPSLQFLWSALCGHRNTPVFPALLNASDPSNLFHNASKHEDLQNEPTIINPQGELTMELIFPGWDFIPCATVVRSCYSPYGSRKYPSTAKSSPKRCRCRFLTCAAWLI